MEKLNFETINANYYYGNYPKFELIPKYDRAKSFYKKAYVIQYNKDTLLLQSYDTIVAHIYKGKFISYGKYSHTTTRHQNEFEEQFAS